MVNTPMPLSLRLLRKAKGSTKPNDQAKRRELGGDRGLLRSARSRRIDQAVIQKHGEMFDDDGGNVDGRGHYGLPNDDTDRILRSVDRREIQGQDQACVGIRRDRDGETLGKWPALVVLLIDVLKGGGRSSLPAGFYLVLYIAVRHATDSFPNFHIESPVVIGLPKPRPQASPAHSFTLWSAADYSGSCRTSRVPSSPPLESRYYVNRSEEGG